MIEYVLQQWNLNNAYQKVCANKGAGGVDGMDISQLKAHLQTHGEALVEHIRNGSYQPSPIKGVEIPKSNGKTRMLGIPTLTDRVIQQALHQVLEPVFEPGFQSHSYGFRPNRNAQQAVLQAQRNINEGYQHVIDIDLKSFFDQVDHAILLELIHRKVTCRLTMKLLRKFLRAPMQIKGTLYKRRQGVPQGSPLSPLLSNILLNELDRELEKRGHRYVRYADDFSIYVRSKRAARRVGNSIYLFLRDVLRLPINREKSGIRRPSTFDILGYHFVPVFKKGARGQYQLVVSAKSRKAFKRKLKELTRKTIPISFAERIRRLNRLIRGWLNYFKLANIHGKLQALDSWLRKRLRYCIWHHWKKPERKRKNLMRLGVNSEDAYAWSRTRMGGWRVAQSPILKTTITLARLKKRGYIAMLELYHQIRPT
ncbi:MAG: group II intron reverse transcriptase/maturase [Halomonas sp.]|nr:group II intron reverse transcriptase/maturase [Halomonas sp.]TVM04583.1 MAG: group II intron reverse transcriptase/maturase [Halomonas sp.]